MDGSFFISLCDVCSPESDTVTPACTNDSEYTDLVHSHHPAPPNALHPAEAQSQRHPRPPASACWLLVESQRLSFRDGLVSLSTTSSRLVWAEACVGIPLLSKAESHSSWRAACLEGHVGRFRVSAPVNDALTVVHKHLSQALCPDTGSRGHMINECFHL